MPLACHESMGEVEGQLHSFLTVSWYSSECSASHPYHCTPWKKTLVLTEQKTFSTPELVWTLENAFTVPGITQQLLTCPACSLVPQCIFFCFYKVSQYLKTKILAILLLLCWSLCIIKIKFPLCTQHCGLNFSQLLLYTKNGKQC